MSRLNTPPPALPPEVVDDIWDQVRAVDVPPRSIREMTQAFTEIAMGSPHYAVNVEIADALGLTTNAVTPLVLHVKQKARKAR